MTKTRPPLWRTWLAARLLFAAVLGLWLLIGASLAIGQLTVPDDASGTIRCADGSYPASKGEDEHRCFKNGTAPAAGFEPDPMSDHQREEN